MSRIGKAPVPVPAGVKVSLSPGHDTSTVVEVSGKNGVLQVHISKLISVSHENGQIQIQPTEDSKAAASLWGLSRTLVNNAVVGVTAGFSRTLELVGVGYKANISGSNLFLSLGYSHDICYSVPEGIEIVCEKPTVITIKGRDKQKVGQVAAVIRGMRPPEPYKGKGVRYSDEQVRKKDGKKK